MVFRKKTCNNYYRRDIMEAKKYNNLLRIARALEEFKLKCYKRMNKDPEYDDFILNNAPCNYDLNYFDFEKE
jgi:hypothetical protein